MAIPRTNEIVKLLLRDRRLQFLLVLKKPINHQWMAGVVEEVVRKE
jgi:hypothetical protein